MKIRKKIVITLITAILLTLFALSIGDKKNTVSNASSVDVGQGLSEWKDHYFAPFVDITATSMDYTDDYYVTGGTLNLQQVMDDVDEIDYFNIGFINPIDTILSTDITGLDEDIMNYSFGGFSTLSPYYAAINDTDEDDQYTGILEQLAAIRSEGKDFAISIGGLTGSHFFQQDDITKDLLIATYEDIITKFGLTRLDFDIEDSATLTGDSDGSLNTLNAEALKQVVEDTGVEISITLAVNPDGLGYYGLGTLDIYLDNDIVPDCINIMQMCYGTWYMEQFEEETGSDDFGEASVAAMEATKDEIIDAWDTYFSETLTDSEAYGLLGSITSIGLEATDENYITNEGTDSNYPLFTTTMEQTVYDASVEAGIQMMSFWNMNRDTLADENYGIDTNYVEGGCTDQYAYTDVIKDFDSNFESTTTNTYTVTFESNGGSDVLSQNIDEGDYVTEPTDPTYSGYTFVGWYTDSDFETKYDFTDEVTSSFTLYAKWVSDDTTTYTVTFDSNGGSTVQSQNIEEGGTVSEPNDPTYSGYTFVGWYTDSDFETKYDFTDEVTSSFTLYAKWAEEGTTSTITFDSNGGSDVDEITDEIGDSVNEPDEPTMDGYLFVGWYTDSDLTDAYTFSTMPDDDLTLYAKWAELETTDLDVDDISDIKSNLTDDQLDELESVDISSTKIDSSELSSSTISSITSVIDSDETIGYYVNISIYAYLSDESYIELTDLNSEITITLTLNSSYRGHNSYGIVRYHDGTATIIDASYDSDDETITFSSDQFSTYAIYYTDTDSSESNIGIIIGIIIAVVILGGAGLFFIGKKKNTKKA